MVTFLEANSVSKELPNDVGGTLEFQKNFDGMVMELSKIGNPNRKERRIFNQ